MAKRIRQGGRLPIERNASLVHSIKLRHSLPMLLTAAWLSPKSHLFVGALRDKNATCASHEARRLNGTGVGFPSQMALTSFELGRLKLLAHVREELDRAGIEAQSIQCKSGGILTPPGIARLTIIANATPATLDFTSTEIEECESIVAGEPWHKIAAFIARLAR